jgi:hypothetical protein
MKNIRFLLGLYEATSMALQAMSALNSSQQHKVQKFREKYKCLIAHKAKGNTTNALL